MKKFRFYILAILIIGCAQEENIDGYWFGSFKFGKDRSPALLKFENGKFIDVFGLNDTIPFEKKEIF